MTEQRALHLMCTYDTREGSGSGAKYCDIYRQVGRYLSEGQSVIYAVEGNPATAVQSMSSSLGRQLVENSIQNGALSVMDRNSIYSTDKTRNLDAESLVSQWGSFVKGSKKRKGIRQGKRLGGKNADGGILILGGMNAFFETNSEHKLADYERHIEAAIRKQGNQQRYQLVCCYPTEWVEKLTFRHLVPILDSHDFTIHSGWNYSRWFRQRIVKHIGEAIDKELGAKSSRLIFGTLRTVYKISEDIVIDCPEVFEDKINKILGIHAKRVLDSIESELRKSAAFSAATPPSIG